MNALKPLIFLFLIGGISSVNAVTAKDEPSINIDKLGKLFEDNFYSIVDNFTQQTGAFATIFFRKGDDFIRVTTSLKKEDGSRAINSKLEHSHPAYSQLLAGESYIGEAKLFDNNYLTKYIPIKDDRGDVLAILFVGQRI